MELSQRVMSLVDKIVKKTEEKIDDNAGVLEMVLDAAAEETGEWKVPLSKERINAMRKVREVKVLEGTWNTIWLKSGVNQVYSYYTE
jgi:hypothetical protein